MNIKSKIISIIGLVAMFMFLVVVSYCTITIIFTRNEDRKASERETLKAQRIQQMIQERQIVVSNEKPHLIVVD